MTLLHRFWVIALASLLGLATGCQSFLLMLNNDDVTITTLRCEYHENPLGIDSRQPRLSWQIASDVRGQKQTAYHVLVASTPEKLAVGVGDLWDSGKVLSDQTIQLAYQGKPLASHMHCYWKVMVWDKAGEPTIWSTPAMWSMGLLDASAWQAQWIGLDDDPDNVVVMGLPDRNMESKSPVKEKRYYPAPYLRKTFNVSRKIMRATLYTTAQGVVEMHINDERVGKEYFTPGWTDYRKRIYYRTYDVTDQLNPGDNCLGAILGDGWFRGNISILGQNQYGDKLRLLSQLHIDYADGSSEVIVTDDSWKGSFGPIILSDMQEGETYDARKALTGWANAAFNDQAWQAVGSGSVISPLIEAYPGSPVRKTREIIPVNFYQIPSGDTVFDLGQNFSGWARLKVKGKAGQKITLQFAEMLNDDGTMYTDNLRSAGVTDHYILSGNGTEVWEPHFTFHGFRYVQVTGLTGKATTDTITGIVIHSDAALTSDFACANPMLNQLFSNIIWGQLSNYLEVPTDCPQRDERLGWTGDTQVFARTGTFNQDVAAFFTKWNIDLMDTQNESGTFGQQAPVFHGWGSPAWADAGVICPWTIYTVYGDVNMIEKHYDQMAKFIAHCKRIGLGGNGGGFGDWLAIDSKTPKALISTAYFGYTTGLMVEIAEALGKTEDAEAYRKLFVDIFGYFQKTFINEDGTIGEDSQTGYCLALRYNLLTNEQRKAAAANLVARIKAKDYHLSTGFVGTGILLNTLTEIGRSDLAYRLIQNTTYPSWGYSIEQGATTVWERWNSYTKKDGFGDVNMNSFNHYAYGACGEWMFRTMLGIDTASDGYKVIVMKPELDKSMSWAKGHYDSIRGRIASDWRVDDNTFHWKVTVPPNTTATLYIPATDTTSVTEGGKALNDVDGVMLVGMKNDRAVMQVHAGHYEFVSSLK